MRILVVSDSHGNVARLKHAFGFADKAGINAAIHCGDWDNAEAAATTKDVNVPVYSVLGNADVARSVEITRALKENGVHLKPGTLNIELGGRRIVVNHFPGRLKAEVKSGNYDVGFHGHFHRPKKEKIGNTLVVNPGALHRTSQPSFAVYDTEVDGVEFVAVAI